MVSTPLPMMGWGRVLLLSRRLQAGRQQRNTRGRRAPSLELGLGLVTRVGYRQSHDQLTCCHHSSIAAYRLLNTGGYRA